MYAAAFFESDPRKVVEAGLALAFPRQRLREGHPRRARLVGPAPRRLAEDLAAASRTSGTRTIRAPTARSAAFNIDARLNGAYIASACSTARGDFAKTIEIATRCGQDSDCNPSSAAGVLGVMLGYERIPDVWKSGIPAIAATRFSYTSFTFETIVASTLRRALKVIEGAGGTLTATEVSVPLQAPKPPPLEQWAPDPPRMRLEPDAPAWTWGAGWSERTLQNQASQRRVRSASSAGAELVLRFHGTGVGLVGTMSQSGGRADVFLDGTSAGLIDAWIPPNTHDNDLWHATGLKSGDHQLRVVTRADRDERSTGNEVVLERAIVYGN